MADFSICSAGTLFYGKSSRLSEITKWWKYAAPHSPSTIVDSTKIRLIALYLTQSYALADTNPFKELPGLQTTPSQSLTPTCPSAIALPRRTHRHGEDKDLLRSTDRQFWLSFNNHISLTEVNGEICKHFARIPFHHWIQAALGYRSEAVDDLFLSVSMIKHKHKQLSDRLPRTARVRSLPEGSNMHPLAKAIFDDRCDPFLPMDHMDFVLDPIRRVIRNCSRSALAQQLIMLGIRYEAAFIQPTMVRWSTTISTNFDFLHTLHSEGPVSLARSTTEADVDVLSDLTVEQLQEGTSTAADVRWTRLCRDVEESLVSSQAESGLIGDFAKELYFRRNYFSMTAVIAGIKAVKRYFPDPPACLNELARLEDFLDETNNYAYCRNRTIMDSGLPWLAPFRAQFASLMSKCYSSTRIAVANLALQICCYDKSLYVSIKNH